ncbi:hypothetical protein UFOVP615_50 [uncultured Caudovirales phage]|uniref:Uncharacterized protein n=1 Tax=uncultured Caudovirales phage TaxID=2100421 RepID=A0A6J5N369_9CAUD|nr:hypothetical protein UFOVP615_50 [uncultured Caudovirales phage]
MEAIISKIVDYLVSEKEPNLILVVFASMVFAKWFLRENKNKKK